MSNSLLLSSERKSIFSESFLNHLEQSLNLAQCWLMDVAQVKQSQLEDDDDPSGLIYDDWQGAIRGEYSVSRRRWSFFCPYWHSSQAAKALVMSQQHGSADEVIASARLIGDFLMRHRISDPDDVDYGMPLAYEDTPHTINTSAILEAMDGLFFLADVTGEKEYEAAALQALRWVAENAYSGGGVFKNSYDPVERQFTVIPCFQRIPEPNRDRPLIDDAVFLKAYLRGGGSQFREIFFEIAERLLAKEYPAGNWMSYSPCNESVERIHPRHAYWWGGPMFDAWHESRDTRFRDAALRSVEWYAQALRKDGGLLRGTYADFTTDSFGHATSGSACAAILFLRSAIELNEPRFLPLAKRALEFCIRAQFTTPADPNLRGAILEKVLPPDGTDASPYYLRDLGTIFFVQAASLCLKHFR